MMMRAPLILALLLCAVAPARSAANTALPNDYEALRSAALDNLERLDNENERIWRPSRAKDVSFDLRRGTIRWEFEAGTALSSVELIGVWSPQTETLIWGWSHPMAPRGTPVSSGRLASHARKSGFDRLWRPEIECVPDRCRELAAMAVLAGGLSGLHRFRLNASGAWAYLGFGRVRRLRWGEK